MNLQQGMQPKSPANGFGRRRGERDGGPHKVQSGKSNPNRSTNTVPGGKAAQVESPSRDRLVYLTTCLIGHPVEVHLKNGSIFSGICYTTNVEKELAIVLRMARLTKDVSFRGQRTEFVSKAPSKTLILSKDVVQVIAKDLSVTMDGMSSELQQAKHQELMLDSSISQPHHLEDERELSPWVPDDDSQQRPELENIFDAPWNRGWDQFETNEMLFGVRSTFDEELYTTRLERGPQMREREREAMRIAREIEGEDTHDLHLAEERGLHNHETHAIDEETRFSSVYRGREATDSWYKEIEDTMMDSCNSETFEDLSAPTIKKSSDLTHGKSIDGAQVLSTSSLDEAQCCQSGAGAGAGAGAGTGTELSHSGSDDQSQQLASELPSKHISTSHIEKRIQENLHGEHRGHESIKEFIEEQTPAKDSQLPRSEDSELATNSMQDVPDKGRLSPNAAAYAPSSHVSSTCSEKAVSRGQQPEAPTSVKGAGDMQSVNSRGQPSSSTSSNSDCIGAASASSGPGLSPSSSVGSLSSEKSTLNPHAKEFKLNPNAKSFTPSQTPVRPPSPVPDGAFYFPSNISSVQHMHGVPMGISIGPSFTGHQPVIFNPQVAPLQTPQAYFHPGGPQYGQQMLLGHPRPLVYMPNYQPEMPYKGREF